MLVSIIIPTLNEEAYLSGLLRNIREQSFTDYEIIVADADSTDRTRAVAAGFNARIVAGGLPAVGRNIGAREAAGDFLLFLDSDVTLPPDFLARAFAEIEEKFLDLATCEMYPDSQLTLDRAIYNSFNLLMKLNAHTNPMAASCIFITKRLFNRISGYDEKIKIAEDFNMVKKAVRFRPLEILESTSIEISVRRLVKEGRLSFIKKSIAVAFYRTFIGEICDDTFEYEFAGYDTQDDDRIARQLRRIDQLLIDAELAYRKQKQDQESRRHLFREQVQKQIEDFREQIKDTLFIARKRKK